MRRALGACGAAQLGAATMTPLAGLSALGAGERTGPPSSARPLHLGGQEGSWRVAQGHLQEQPCGDPLASPRHR